MSKKCKFLSREKSEQKRENQLMNFNGKRGKNGTRRAFLGFSWKATSHKHQEKSGNVEPCFFIMQERPFVCAAFWLTHPVPYASLDCVGNGALGCFNQVVQSVQRFCTLQEIVSEQFTGGKAGIHVNLKIK